MRLFCGGHVAASLGTMWNDPELLKVYDNQGGKNRPNAMILLYPVITADQFAHQLSIKLVSGCEPGTPGYEYFSLDKRVSQDTCPAFLWHSMEDGVVPVENSIQMMTALHNAGVAVEAHFFPHGMHGTSACTEETFSRGRLQRPLDGSGPDLAGQHLWIPSVRGSVSPEPLFPCDDKVPRQIVTVTVDRELGSHHPEYPDLLYPVNYGYIRGIQAPDGEEQDAYLLGVYQPVKEFTGEVIAIIHRKTTWRKNGWLLRWENGSLGKKSGKRSAFRNNTSVPPSGWYNPMFPGIRDQRHPSAGNRLCKRPCGILENEYNRNTLRKSREIP